MLHENNSYIRSLKYALEAASTPNVSLVIDAGKKPASSHIGRFNASTCNEVAVFIRGQRQNRRDNTKQNISETEGSYDNSNTHFFFLTATTDISLEFLCATATQLYPVGNSTPTSSSIAMTASIVFIAQNSFQSTCMCKNGILTNFYIVNNQTRLWSDNYIHLRDGIRNDIDPENLGKVCILSSTFIGSPRLHE